MQLPTSKTALLTIVLTVLAGNSIWHASQAKAQGRIAPSFRAYGIIGIASGQTARLNAVTVGVRQEILIELSFLDREGNVLARTVERASPGRAISLELRFIPGPSGNRLPIRGLVRWAAQLGQEEYVIHSMEVIDDATGRTVLGWPNPEG
jgi:hypothetical protein